MSTITENIYKERFKVIFDDSLFAKAIFNREMQIIHCNKTFMRLFEFEHGLPEILILKDLFPPEEQGAYNEVTRQIMSKEIDQFFAEWR